MPQNGKRSKETGVQYEGPRLGISVRIMRDSVYGSDYAEPGVEEAPVSRSTAHLLDRGLPNGVLGCVVSERQDSESCPVSPLLPKPQLLTVSQLLEADPHQTPQSSRLGPTQPHPVPQLG